MQNALKFTFSYPLLVHSCDRVFITQFTALECLVSATVLETQSSGSVYSTKCCK